jgi:hypothetical protein
VSKIGGNNISNQPITFDDTLVSGGRLKIEVDYAPGAGSLISHTALQDIGTNTHAQIDSHIADIANPHAVTKAQVGLSDVDNTSDVNKPISTATQTALNLKYDASNPSGYQTSAQVTSTVTAASTADRSRANHTGTQLSSTISDFASTVRETVLTGLSLVSSTVISATDTVLVALGSLQAQISLRALASRLLSNGYGITGGGNLTADRTLAVSLTTSSSVATNQISTTSLTDVLVTSMTLTPAAGTYLVLFYCSVDNTNDSKIQTFSIYVGGVRQDNTVTPTTGYNIEPAVVSVNTLATVNGSQAIAVYWRTNANTARITTRSLILLRVS